MRHVSKNDGNLPYTVSSELEQNVNSIQFGHILICLQIREFQNLRLCDKNRQNNLPLKYSSGFQCAIYINA